MAYLVAIIISDMYIEIGDVGAEDLKSIDSSKGNIHLARRA